MDESLSFESFLEGAKKAAHRAMDDHARKEYDEFALHAGVAAERLAKAILVDLNPVYLTEMRSGNADMLMYFGGHLDEVSKIRTIGASEAIARLRRLEALPPDPQLDLLIELRNGAAHTARSEGAKDLLPALARTVARLMHYVRRSPESFWGRWADAVRISVDTKQSAIVREVQLRIGQARHTFEDRFSGLPAEIRERALTNPAPTDAKYQVNAARLLAMSKHDALRVPTSVKCPACSGQATLIFVTGSVIKNTVSLHPRDLACDLCGLELFGTEELVACGELESDSWRGALENITFVLGDIESWTGPGIPNSSGTHSTQAALTAQTARGLVDQRPHDYPRGGQRRALERHREQVADLGSRRNRRAALPARPDRAQDHGRHVA